MHMTPQQRSPGLFQILTGTWGRAVGAGPASPAAARPIVTRAKDFGGGFNCCSKSSYAKGPWMTAVIHKISVGAGGKHTLSPVEA